MEEASEWGTRNRKIRWDEGWGRWYKRMDRRVWPALKRNHHFPSMKFFNGWTSFSRSVSTILTGWILNFFCLLLAQSSLFRIFPAHQSSISSFILPTFRWQSILMTIPWFPAYFLKQNDVSTWKLGPSSGQPNEGNLIKAWVSSPGVVSF